MRTITKGFYNQYFLLFLLSFFTNTFLLAQNTSQHNVILESLIEIDEKIDNWQRKEALSILKNLEKKKKTLNIKDKYAIELRRFKVEYYINDNDENFDIVLRRVKEIEKLKDLKLEYDYLSFIGQVYKISFNFENAIHYHRKALFIAETREDTVDIVFSCWSLGSSYYLIEYINKPEFYKNKLDSALHFYNKALKFPENKKTNTFLPRVYNNLGRIETAKRNFNKSKNYIYKALSLHKQANDSFGISISLNNLSKLSLEENEYNKSIDQANKSNEYIKGKSLRIKRNNLEYIAESNYKLGNIKVAYAKMKETVKVSDELTNRTFINNVKKIETKYEVAKEQQNTLEEKNKRLQLQMLLYITGFSIIILGIIGFIFYSRNKRFRKSFDELIEKNKTYNSKGGDIDLPSDTINNILNGLKRFEKEKLYLQKNTNLKDLAKELKTNSSYLSKVVNTYKNKNFTAYLNELRIQYAIQELTNSKELRLFTIEAIADHMGYNNGESFASAFRKITDIYPSYFIKQLQKQ